MRLTQRPERVSIPDVDRGLARAIGPDQAALARRALVVGAIRVPEGEFLPRETRDLVIGGLGLLITSGYVGQQLHVGNARSLELVGPGDLIRPFEADAASPVSFAEARFRAFSNTELAVLDSGFAPRAAHFPGLVGALVERAARRSRYLAVQSAINGMVGVEKRLTALLWMLAERWGRVSGGEILVPLPLSHMELAQMVAARRPSVTSAMSALQRAGTVTRVKEGWLLRGSPPDSQTPEATAGKSKGDSEI